MKGLIFLALLALCVVGYLIMVPEPSVPAPAGQETEKGAQPPPPSIPVVEPEPPKRTPEQIREETRLKAEAAERAERERQARELQAGKDAAKAALMAKKEGYRQQIASKRSSCASLDKSIAAQVEAVRQSAAQTPELQVRANKKIKQWRYVRGGVVRAEDIQNAWQDGAAPRAGVGAIKWREVPMYPGADVELAAHKTQHAELVRQLENMRSERAKLESECTNLGLLIATEH